LPDINYNLANLIIKIFEFCFKVIKILFSKEFFKVKIRSIFMKGLLFVLVVLPLCFYFSPKLLNINFLANYKDPILSILFFLSITCLVLLIPTFKYYYHKVNIDSFESSGLDHFYSNENGKHKEKIKSEIEKNCDELRELDLILASGMDTISFNCFLNKTIEETKAKIRILLLKPDCEAAEGRAKRIGILPNIFKTRIKENIMFLENIQRENKDLQFRLYEDDPIWKIIEINNSKMFVLNYQSPYISMDTPCSFYQILENNSNDIYYTYKKYFESLWNKASNKREFPRLTVNSIENLQIDEDKFNIYIKNISDNGIYFTTNNNNLFSILDENKKVNFSIPTLAKEGTMKLKQYQLHKDANYAKRFICQIET